MPGALDKLFLDFQSALAGRYSIERELGRGGMGIVYLAREVRLDRPVALKLLPPDLAAQAGLRDRFLREARMAARLSHPHIVPIHVVDELGGFVFYAMAYVDGDTLAHRIATRGPLPPTEAMRVLREVAWALAHAHAQGVTHRDVKPENILLEAGSGRALVTDFGIARHRDGVDTGAGEVLGTPDFMSPEQASGDPVDARSDVYSLGVVAFYALSGRLPFTGSTAVARLTANLTRPAPPLPSVVPGVPRGLASVVGRCLAKEPERRFSGGAELADALTLATERRELPSALRVFLSESDTLSAHRLYPSFLLGGLAIWLVLSLTLSPVMAPTPPLVAQILDLVRFAAIGGALLGPAAITLRRLRRVIRAGYDHDDLARALAADAERLRDDRVTVTGRAPGPEQRLLHRGWLAATAGFTAFAFSALLNMSWPFPELFGVIAAGTGAVSLLGSGTAWRASVLSGFRRKFWDSAPGRWLFRVAGLGAHRAGMALPADRVGHPTELVVGAAAAALYGALPAEARRALPDLPVIVQRLEQDAQRIRRRCDELGEALAAVESGPAPSGDGGGRAWPAIAERRAALANSLRLAQATSRQRLGDAVAALEVIRLDLLRLRAGGATFDGITADLSAARELSLATDRLLDAAGEVEQLLGTSGGEAAS
ncbi:MAG TPA: serine/threonine-protein kinase [Gemmatimonadales bacterium]|nr:serine/threonine-protein kinase [Gemmatimonadales bacterium]